MNSTTPAGHTAPSLPLLSEFRSRVFFNSFKFVKLEKKKKKEVKGLREIAGTSVSTKNLLPLELVQTFDKLLGSHNKEVREQVLAQ